MQVDQTIRATIAAALACLVPAGCSRLSAVWRTVRLPVAGAAPLCAAILLAGCAEGRRYDAAPAEARSLLATSEMPLMVFGSQALAVETVRRDPGTVLWLVLDARGDEMMRLVARVTAEGSGSRIVADVLPPEGRYHDRVTKGMADNPAVVDLYRKVAAEQVDAAMTGRDFSMAAITPAMMAAAIALVPNMGPPASAPSGAERADHQAQAQARAWADIDRAYAKDAREAQRDEPYGTATRDDEPRFGEPADGWRE